MALAHKYNNFPCIHIDMFHEYNLLASFVGVLLIDTLKILNLHSKHDRTGIPDIPMRLSRRLHRVLFSEGNEEHRIG